MSRPEPRDGYSADVAAAYEAAFNDVLLNLTNDELLEVANEADYTENYDDDDDDHYDYGDDY